ncbi:MAG TPA: hypothetical protein VFU22_24730 [Roseiflexaceae bacterium]|nr:hypothetical protein [Roseiflexaceae bacterium]
MLNRFLFGHIHWIAIALLVTSVGTARAEQRVWAPQVVDGYTVTLTMAAELAPPGDNQVVVAIHDPAGRPVEDAAVSIALLAYLRAVSANPNSASPPSQHVHTPGASATEGQGLIPVPVQLEASAEAGTYGGTVSFAKEGTWTAVVTFTTQGQARAVLFKIGIIDQRPRLVLLGGFVAVNVAIIVAAAVRKRTGRGRPGRQAADPKGGRPPSRLPSGSGFICWQSSCSSARRSIFHCRPA